MSTMLALVAASKKKSASAPSEKLSYSLGMMEMSFSTNSPKKNTTYNVSVVHSLGFFPAVGIEVEHKTIAALSNNQYLKFSKNESSLKEVTRLGQARGLDENIQNYATVMEIYDLCPVFDIVQKRILP